jgi:hypothetical protein
VIFGRDEMSAIKSETEVTPLKKSWVFFLETTGYLYMLHIGNLILIKATLSVGSAALQNL